MSRPFRADKSPVGGEMKGAADLRRGRPFRLEEAALSPLAPSLSLLTVRLLRAEYKTRGVNRHFSARRPSGYPGYRRPCLKGGGAGTRW
jgi:hypothetical protein